MNIVGALILGMTVMLILVIRFGKYFFPRPGQAVNIGEVVRVGERIHVIGTANHNNTNYVIFADPNTHQVSVASIRGLCPRGVILQLPRGLHRFEIVEHRIPAGMTQTEQILVMVSGWSGAGGRRATA